MLESLAVTAFTSVKYSESLPYAGDSGVALKSPVKIVYSPDIFLTVSMNKSELFNWQSSPKP